MEVDGFYTEADWRCHTVVRVSAPSTVAGLGTIPVGAIGKATGIFDYRSGRIAFTIPSATALFLNLSKRHHEAAFAAAQTFSQAPISQKPSDAEAFAYLENIMASVVFGYTALESFANEEIPDDATHTIERNKCTEVYDKAQIERFLSLEVKLGEILPTVCGRTTPKGTKAWSDYIALESLRHSVIHMKKLDREHVGYSSRSVWSRLVKEPIPYAVAVAKGIIDHFYQPRSLRPHWYQNFPF